MSMSYGPSMMFFIVTDPVRSRAAGTTDGGGQPGAGGRRGVAPGSLRQRGVAISVRRGARAARRGLGPDGDGPGGGGRGAPRSGTGAGGRAGPAAGAALGVGLPGAGAGVTLGVGSRDREGLSLSVSPRCGVGRREGGGCQRSSESEGIQRDRRPQHPGVHDWASTDKSQSGWACAEPSSRPPAPRSGGRA